MGPVLSLGSLLQLGGIQDGLLASVLPSPTLTWMRGREQDAGMASSGGLKTMPSKGSFTLGGPGRACVMILRPIRMLRFPIEVHRGNISAYDPLWASFCLTSNPRSVRS